MRTAMGALLVAAPVYSARAQYQIIDLNEVAGADRSYAHAVDAWGRVVGDAVYAGEEYETGTRWEGGGFGSLGRIPGDNRSLAWAINGDGVIAGKSSRVEIVQTWPVLIIEETDTAVVWEGGVLTPLKDLVIGGSGLDLKMCMDIDDAGRIVGFGRHAGVPSPERAFLFDGGVGLRVQRGAVHYRSDRLRLVEPSNGTEGGGAEALRRCIPCQRVG